jgi:hypothetical protein
MWERSDAEVQPNPRLARALEEAELVRARALDQFREAVDQALARGWAQRLVRRRLVRVPEA